MFFVLAGLVAIVVVWAIPSADAETSGSDPTLSEVTFWLSRAVFGGEGMDGVPSSRIEVVSRIPGGHRTRRGVSPRRVRWGCVL